ncbi:MAG TPA: GNAT family N-acetyltransferase, partial [Pyrinomonadaceae bacterium]|nr:GNAT family N-acetyltransferase [Pyrinomonadaceae bacterium]
MESSGPDIALPGGGVVALRPVTPDDAEFLRAVYASTRADELAQVKWDAQQKDAFLRMQADAQRHEYEARYPDAQYDVILLDGAPVGRLWIGRSEAEIRLLDIALLPAAQNRGVGGALMRRLIAEAQQTGKRLLHMVFIMNRDAKR